MATSAGHVRKRQFQPSIDSYFNRDGTSSSTQRSRTEDPLAPALSADTQASLLSVGMRVRKSVPEGYKTHKTIGVYVSPIASSAPTQMRLKTKQRYSTATQRELVPMCGLHKTGGLASQMIISSAPAAIHMDEEDSELDGDDLPGLTASQITLQSNIDDVPSVLFNSSRKRGYEEEMEESLDIYFNDDTAMDSPGPHVAAYARPLARMKLPHRGDSRRVLAMSGENDFDEAAFLVPDSMDVDDL